MGAEKAVSIANIRKRLARILKDGRATRHDMQMAIHPDGIAPAIFARVEARIALLSITLRTEPLAFVVCATETADGLRISEVHEWSAAEFRYLRFLVSLAGCE